MPEAPDEFLADLLLERELFISRLAAWADTKAEATAEAMVELYLGLRAPSR